MTDSISDAFSEAALRLNRDRAQVLLIVEPVEGSTTEWRYGLLEGTAVTSWRRLRVEGKRYTFLDVVKPRRADGMAVKTALKYSGRQVVDLDKPHNAFEWYFFRHDNGRMTGPSRWLWDQYLRRRF